MKGEFSYTFSHRLNTTRPASIIKCFGLSLFGDPYGNRTHVTAVKGRCLNRLTNGPYKKGAGLLRLNLVAAPGFEPGTLRV